MSNFFPKNELTTEHLALHSLNAFVQYNSSSRSTMFASHFSQKLVIEGADNKRVQTGVEQEFGKYTFNIKMPENGRIIKIIDRYPRGIDKDSLQFNPETIVIFENEETKEIDYFSIPYYASFHQYFGFKYDMKSSIANLKPGTFVAKDTIFADSPAVGKNNSYKFGINANVAFMSIPSVSEDGIMISREFLKKLRFRLYETRSIEFGSNQFPLNMYGSKDVYKPFPDIGDEIRSDNILMMLRSYDDDLMPVETSLADTMEPDFTFDKAIYVRGGNGRVVDIKVISNNATTKQLPEAMCGHISKYEKALLKFHNEIIATENQLRFERKRKFGDGKLNLSPKLHRLLVESLAIVNYNSVKLKQNLNLIYRRAPIDEYRIEFVVEYVIEPDIGFKLSDSHG